MLVILLCLSFKAFSQKDTIQVVRLQEPIARLVVKDLIIGDGLQKELAASRKVIETLKTKSITQDSITFNLKSQVINLNSILIVKDDQFKVQEKLSKDLQLALKKEKFKNKLFSIGTPVLILGALLLK
jgi:hypothetical protein